MYRKQVPQETCRDCGEVAEHRCARCDIPLCHLHCPGDSYRCAACEETFAVRRLELASKQVSRTPGQYLRASGFTLGFGGIVTYIASVGGPGSTMPGLFVTICMITMLAGLSLVGGGYAVDRLSDDRAKRRLRAKFLSETEQAKALPDKT